MSATTEFEKFPFTRSAPLHVPPLQELVDVIKASLEQNFEEELVDVIKASLEQNFEEVEVRVETCPNLSSAPWNLAGSGLGGHPKILDIGGELNLFYIKNHDANYDFDVCAKAAGLPSAFMFGPGAGSHKIVGQNCELMANVNVGTGTFGSYIAKMKDETTPVQEPYPSNNMGILVNLLASEGKTGDVIYVRAAKRKGELNLISNIRGGLREKYTPQNKHVGLGGVFQVAKGKVHAHVMPEFQSCDIKAEDCKAWLKFFEFHAPLTCLSVLVTEEIGNLNLRLEHTHFFSEHGEGGHYHYDTTPKGYFVPAEELWRIGQPSHNPTPKEQQ